jgi:hypothetical protein
MKELFVIQVHLGLWTSLLLPINRVYFLVIMRHFDEAYFATRIHLQISVAKFSTKFCNLINIVNVIK